MKRTVNIFKSRLDVFTLCRFSPRLYQFMGKAEYIRPFKHDVGFAVVSIANIVCSVGLLFIKRNPAAIIGRVTF